MLLEEFAAGGALAAYTLIFLATVSELYERMTLSGIPEHLARYINRKIIHAFAAGVATLVTPLAFNTPLVPLALTLGLAALLVYARRRGGMRWFQDDRDANEVTFVVAWGLSLALVWLVTGDKWAAILPPLYISFGDAVTGFTRALVVGRREKHWSGNLAMAALTVPVGVAILGPLWGTVAGVAAALAERIDRPIDDNVAVAVVASLAAIAAKLL